MRGKIKKLEYKVMANGCHKCTSHAQTSRGGYILFKRNRQRHTVTRYLYEKKHRMKIPKGIMARHKCDNKWCINVKHIELGTNHDNMMDCIERQGKLIGENAVWAKITAKQAKEIRYKTEGMCLREIGEKYGLGISQVFRIKRGESWSRTTKEVKPT